MAKKIAVIGIPGKWSTEVLADALEERTGFRLVLDMAEVHADLETNSLWARGVNLCELDGLAVKKISQVYSPNTLDRIELLHLAEKKGVRVFSKAETIIRMIDRLSCTVTLRNGGIPMPKTQVCESVDTAMEIVKTYGEAVFKPLFSTKARGMCVISADLDDATMRAEIEAFKQDNPVMYIQQKLDLPGRDYGMVFLGGRYLGTYARVSQNESWNTTINSGGKYALHEPPQSTIELASKAERLFGMDFTTVDVADTPEGPIVFEVFAFGGFKGAKEGIGIDAAALYADYILEELA
jgi:ribosomal protein S6--L-glutamate ligase